MSDPIRTYLDASNSCDIARTNAKNMIELIAAVSSALNYKLPDFLALKYGLSVSMPGRDRFRLDNSSSLIAMETWPSADQIRTVLAEWHTAFLALHEAWRNVPGLDQKGMREPPRALSTS
jgi:hypothetical protein